MNMYSVTLRDFVGSVDVRFGYDYRMLVFFKNSKRYGRGMKKAMSICVCVFALLWSATSAQALIIMDAESMCGTFLQVDATLRWYTSSPIDATQKEQIDRSILYLRSHGFTKEADQVEKLLKDGLLRAKITAGNRDVAETMGGLSQGIRRAGYIFLFDQFFSPANDHTIGFSSDPEIAKDQKDRFRAKALLHELEHLNTQVNVIAPPTNRLLNDNELGPMKKTAESLRKLGYSDDEIRTISEFFTSDPKYNPYAPLFSGLIYPPDKPINTGSGSGSGSGSGGGSGSGSGSVNAY